jgi:outer membrane receptor protein involved in Fe transport
VTYHASRHDNPPAAGTPARSLFRDRDDLMASPRVAALYHATPATDVRASFYQGFRAPTLNELYRVFRVRNDVTVANANLDPERLTGGEASVQQQWHAVTARVTGFWNDVKDLIVNVTVPTNLPDCPTVPVRTTCRQRQNVDLGRIRGLEAELEVRPARGWRLLASYLFTDAEIVSAPQQPNLEGKRLAQVPRHAYTLGLRWDNPAWVNVAANARFVGSQFEDDVNTLPLGSFVVFDVQLSRPVTRWGEVFVAVENLTNETYATGRTGEGVVSIGAPRLIHGGVRIGF